MIKINNSLKVHYTGWSKSPFFNTSVMIKHFRPKYTIVDNGKNSSINLLSLRGHLKYLQCRPLLSLLSANFEARWSTHELWYVVPRVYTYRQRNGHIRSYVGIHSACSSRLSQSTYLFGTCHFISITRMLTLRGYILGVLMHTTAWDCHW